MGHYIQATISRADTVCTARFGLDGRAVDGDYTYPGWLRAVWEELPSESRCTWLTVAIHRHDPGGPCEH